jgi:hypothetical protein
MMHEYKIIWRYDNQMGYGNYNTFNCYANTKEMAKTIFREKYGYDRKRIVSVEQYEYERKY